MSLMGKLNIWYSYILLFVWIGLLIGGKKKKPFGHQEKRSILLLSFFPFLVLVINPLVNIQGLIRHS